MSDRFGPLAISGTGPCDGAAPPWSEQIIAEIDAETRSILEVAEAAAIAVLDTNTRALDAIAAALVALETLEGQTLEGLLSSIHPAGSNLALVA